MVLQLQLQKEWDFPVILFLLVLRMIFSSSQSLTFMERTTMDIWPWPSYCTPPWWSKHWRWASREARQGRRTQPVRTPWLTMAAWSDFPEQQGAHFCIIIMMMIKENINVLNWKIQTAAILNSSYPSPTSYLYQANVSSGANNTLIWTTRIM